MSYGKSERELIRKIEAQGGEVRDSPRTSHLKIYLASGQLVAILPKRGVRKDHISPGLLAQLRRAGFDV